LARTRPFATGVPGIPFLCHHDIEAVKGKYPARFPDRGETSLRDGKAMDPIPVHAACKVGKNHAQKCQMHHVGEEAAKGDLPTEDLHEPVEGAAGRIESHESRRDQQSVQP
jgi:hypothetical protein